MEREHRHLDGEAQEHSPEHQEGECPGEGPGGAQLGQGLDVEGAITVLARLEVEGEEAQEHERRPEQSEQEELDRRVEAGLHLPGEARHLPRGLVTPDTDHEVHGEEDDLEEDEEQDQIESDEGSVHSRGQDQHQDQERLGVLRLVPVVPGVDHRQHHHEGGEDQERQADPVDSDVVVGVDRTDPGLVGLELIGVVSAGAEVEVELRVIDSQQSRGSVAIKQGDAAFFVALQCHRRDI